MFVSGVIVNWKMFYTIGGVLHFRKLKSNWKYISLTVKYPTHTWKIFYTIILPSNHFHSSANSSPHSLSSLIPSPSQRVKKATAGEAQIQSSTHNPIVIPVSPFAGEGSLSSTPPLSSLFHSLDPSLFLPQFRSALIWAHLLTLSLILKSMIMKMRVSMIASPQPIPHPRCRCPKWFFYYYCKITFVLGFWRIDSLGDSWVSKVVGWGWV